MTTVKIDSSTVDRVIDVQTTSRKASDLSDARIDVVDTATNRNFQPGDSVTIDFGSGVSWTGTVTGQPSTSSGILTYSAHGEMLPFKHERAYRVFYERETSEIVKDLVTERTIKLGQQLSHTGDTASDWASQAPVAEVYDGGRAGLYAWGTNLLFLGAREGRSEEIRTTYTDVSSDVIEDGFFELQTRLITRDLSGIWSMIIELKTPSGTSYRWTPEIQDGPTTYNLAAENAEPEDSGLKTGELRYRWIPDGTTIEPFGVFIDNAATIPFVTESRPDAPTINDVGSSGRTITRRVDASVGDAVRRIATGDNAEYRRDDDGFSYYPGGGLDQAEQANLSIDESSDPIINVSVDRDFEEVRNEVVVRGGTNADGEQVEVLVRDQASINFYGRVRGDTINDPEIKTNKEARERGRGYLEGKAWDDATVTLSIADLAFAQLQGGDPVDVTYSDEDLDGIYTTDAVTTNSNGVVDVSVIASTGR